MWFSRLNRTISHASGASRRRNVLAHCTPPNPPPTMTTRFGVVLMTRRIFEEPCHDVGSSELGRFARKIRQMAACTHADWGRLTRAALLVSGQPVRADEGGGAGR